MGQGAAGARIVGLLAVVFGLTGQADAFAARRGQGGGKSAIRDRLPFVRAGRGERGPGHGGVGMVLNGGTGKVRVGRVVPGGPAAGAGVRAGDEVIAVDGRVVAPKTPTGKVAAGVRGRVGTTVVLTVRRRGVAAPVTLRIRREAMVALFPKLSREVVAVRAGTALVAHLDARTLGLRFTAAGAYTAPVAYRWAVAPRGSRLGAEGADRGRGLVRWSRRGATIQLDSWRLDLAPSARTGGLVVRASTLPVAVLPAASWLRADPARLRYVRPREEPQPYRRVWPAGPCRVRVSARVAGRPAAKRRLTLWLVDDGGRGMPTASTRTDADGLTSLRLPAGHFRVAHLYASLSGSGRDLYYEASLPRPTPELRCAAGPRGARAELELRLARATKPPRPVALSLPTSARTHKLIGRSLPWLKVRRWFGGAGLPRTLRGHALLLYVWATWCGPCKRVSPLVAELHARLADRGLVVVAGSVDRDEVALADYAAGQLGSAAPIAWLGPTAMGELGISGIPTIFAVDHKGVVRVVQTGTGVGLRAWQELFEGLLAQAGR